MQIKTFLLSATDANEQNEEELNLFLRGHRILSLDREFVSNGQYLEIFDSPHSASVG